tara:strand:+ start:2245 stop:2901 length:657 start_codon:yes stop_codon:yes gene_type:complete
MANKFILYREHPKGGIVSDGVLRDNSQVIGIYDSAADVPVPSKIDIPDIAKHYVIEYDWDPTVDTVHNLVLNASKDGFDKKWTGKTVAEQRELHHQENIEIQYKEKKWRHARAINVIAGERIEKLEGWRIERAKQQDFLAGTTSNQTSAYQAIEDVRASSNVKQAELSPIDPTTAAGRAAIDAFDPYDFGAGEEDGLERAEQDDTLLATTQDYDHTKA